jgi:CO/xanthine dehydrogenase FAD-binding subunit
MGRYVRPAELSDALALMAQHRYTVLAGGTDFYPARVGKPITEDIVDITGIAELRGIIDEGDDLRIGATTTWSEIRTARLPPWLDGLKGAAREVGGAQIQNTGTVAGNLCNASPAADGVPALLALDAAVELETHDGKRRLPLGEFITGNRRTDRRPSELLTAIRLPKPKRETRSTFLKLGARRYLVISIAMVAATLEIEGDRIAAARLAVGACSAAARRLPVLETRLRGLRVGTKLGDFLDDDCLEPLAPIDDIRGTSAYRRDAVRTLIRRSLEDLAAGVVA